MTESPTRVLAALWMYLTPILVCFGLSMPWLDVSAKAQMPYFRNVELPAQSHRVNAVYRCEMGMVWIGTNEGLYNYDGFIARPTFINNARANTAVHDIISGDKGLYLATDNGLLLFDMPSYSYIDSPEGSPTNLRALQAFGDNILAGGLDGLYLYDTTRQTWNDLSEGLPHRSVYSIDTNDDLYFIGTYNGLGLITQSMPHAATYRTGYETPQGTNLALNTLMYVPESRLLYAGTDEGAYYYDFDSDSITKIADLNDVAIHSFAAADDGSIYAGTNQGLYRLVDGQVDTVYLHDSRSTSTIANDIIYSLHRDDANNLWIGTDYGASQLVRQPHRKITYLADLTDTGHGNVISSIVRADSTTVWYGGNNGVIMLDDDDSLRWYRADTPHYHIEGGIVEDILRDSDGRMWIASNASISLYDTDTQRFERFFVHDRANLANANHAYSLYDDNRCMWIGANPGGVMVVDKHKFDLANRDIVADTIFDVRNGMPNGHARAITGDGNGRVFALFGASPMIAIFDTNDISHKLVSIDSKTIPVCAMYDRRSRILWVGYRSGLAMLRDKADEFVTYPLTLDMPDDLMSITRVGDKLWISTIEGLLEFDPMTGIYKPLPLSEGNFPAIYVDRQTDNVLLGGVDRIAEVPLTDAAELTQRPKQLVMTDIMVNGSEMTNVNPMSLKSLTLKPDENYVEMRFSDLEFHPNPRAAYEYRLRGATDNFTLLDQGATTIRLSIPLPGDYTLEIRTPGDTSLLYQLPITKEDKPLMSPIVKIAVVAVLIVLMIFILVQLRLRAKRRKIERQRDETHTRVKNRIDFLTNVSHELKTPLSMVIGPVSQLIDETNDPVHRHKLEVVLKHANKLNSLLQSALEINRTDTSEEMLLIPTEIDLVDFCNDILENFGALYSERKMTFKTSAETLRVRVDVVKMESIINNLVSNACKYSPMGSPVTMSIDVDDKYVTISVEDHGQGISESDLGNIFNRLYRSNDAPDDTDGNGIGLYLTKKYIEMHSGTIEVDSRVNDGTTVRVKLPLSKIQCTDTIDDLEAETLPNNEHLPLVLIVEDNTSIAGFISDILRDNYRCLHAANGRQALATMASITPVLVITDLIMPEMDGLELIRKIRANVRLRAMPIVVISAKDDAATRSEVSDAGADDFLPKPFDTHLLRSRVARLTDARDKLTRALRADLISTPADTPDLQSVDERLMKQISGIIEDNLSESQLTVTYLAERTAMSSKQLYRLVKKYTGVTPVDLIRTMRLRKAAMLLSQGKFSVSEAMYMSGFNSSSYFAKCFTTEFGMSPRAYAEQSAADRNAAAQL